MRAKIIAITVLTLLFISSSALSYTTNSFRNQSTAFTLDDDLDQWIADYSLFMPNPSGLFKFDGYRLYTNLSNLVDKNEEQFSNTSLDNFLMGGSGYLYRGYRFGSLINRYCDDSRIETGADRSVFTDNDGNGTYDAMRRYLSGNVHDTTSTENDFIFALAGRRSNLDYGFAYSMYSSGIITEISTSVDTVDTDLITNMYNRTAHGDNLNGLEDDFRSHTFTFGGLYRYSSNLSIGGRLGLSMRKQEEQNNGDNSYNLDRSPSDPNNLDIVLRTNQFNISRNYSGNTIKAGLTFEYQTTPNIFSIFEITGYTGKMDDDGGAYNRTIRQTAYLSLGADTTFTTLNATVTGANAYEDERQGIGFHYRSVVTLANDVTLAFGFSLNGSSQELIETTSPDSVSVEVFDDGDNQPDDPDDYTRTVTGSYSVQDKTTSSTMELAIPVGMEFYPLKKLAVRLGARFVYNNTETENTYILLSSTAPRERIVYGDGSVTEALLQNPYTPYNNTSGFVKDEDYTTNYYYVAGWIVTENLTLDFMGFYQLTNLWDWKLSAVFKFF